MGKILNAEEGKHIVKEYSFKSLDINGNTIISKDNKEEKIIANVEEPVKEAIKDNKLELIEELLKKSEEFNNSISRLEQQLQIQAQNYENKLAVIKLDIMKVIIQQKKN
jgi:hypothetical protein